MSGDTQAENDARYLGAMISHPDPVVTSNEIAGELGVSQQAAHQKLEGLEERDLVKSKKVGARARVWWLTTSGREAYWELKS